MCHTVHLNYNHLLLSDCCVVEQKCLIFSVKQVSNIFIGAVFVPSNTNSRKLSMDTRTDFPLSDCFSNCLEAGLACGYWTDQCMEILAQEYLLNTYDDCVCLSVCVCRKSQRVCPNSNSLCERFSFLTIPTIH